MTRSEERASQYAQEIICNQDNYGSCLLILVFTVTHIFCIGMHAVENTHVNLCAQTILQDVQDTTM